MSACGEGEVIDVSREVSFQGDSGLIVLKVSFVVRDPKQSLAILQFGPCRGAQRR